MRKNEDNRRDNDEWFRDSVVCGYVPVSIEMFYQHRRECNSCKEKAINDGEAVRCPKCEYASSQIKTHLKKVHKMTDEEIQKDNIECFSSGYKRRMSESVRSSVMNSPEERKRRSKLLGELNKTKAFRDKASKTAKITSSRPDILLDRAKRLEKWRNENLDVFQNECTKKMLSGRKKWKKSKPEIFMISWLENKYPKTFEWGKMLRSKEFSLSGKSDRKQIDFRSKDRSIFIEIDGPFHFENLSRKQTIDSSIIDSAITRAIERDKVLEKVILQKNKTLIRIGYGCWKNRNGKIKEEVLQKLSSIIDQKIVGIFKIGEIYGEDSCL